jgi:hypothetical protein
MRFHVGEALPELPVVAAAAVPAVAAAAAAEAPVEVVQQRRDGSAIVMCGIAITMIVGGGNGNDGKTLMQWDSTFAA